MPGVAAPLPEDELERLGDLYAYEILDTDPEEAFEDIVRLAATICETPWARVNFVDAQRQWTKAVLGMDKDDTPRDEAFCPHTIVAPEGLLMVDDALADDRFRDNPHVVDDPGVRFYAGSAIRASSGRPVGAVCVLDTRPRSLTPGQVDALRSLSEIASRQLELRRRLSDERRLVEDLRELDRQKAAFSAAVAHDFRTPLTSIQGYAQLLREGAIPPDKALEVIDRATDRLLRLVDSVSGAPRTLEYSTLDLAELARATVELIQPAAGANGVELRLDAQPAHMHGDARWLAHVLDNLIGNAVKYAPDAAVDVRVRNSGLEVVLEVRDTGVGIPAEELPRVFDRFYRASTSDGFAGTGVGLSIVKEIVEKHGGSVSVESAVGAGTTFRAALPVQRAER